MKIRQLIQQYINLENVKIIGKYSRIVGIRQDWILVNIKFVRILIHIFLVYRE